MTDEREGALPDEQDASPRVVEAAAVTVVDNDDIRGVHTPLTKEAIMMIEVTTDTREARTFDQ